MSERTPLLVLGLGNILCGDDGLGVAAIRELEAAWAPADGVRVVDGGTLGLALLPYLEDADGAILVDAIAADHPPGSVVRLCGDEVPPAIRQRLSPHQVGVTDLLDSLALLDRMPDPLILVGQVPAGTELSLELSDPVREGLPFLLGAVVQTAAELGFPFRRLEAVAG